MFNFYKKNKKWSSFLIAGVLFFMTSSISLAAIAGRANLQWTVLNTSVDPNKDLAKYRIYYDTVSHASSCPAGYASSASGHSGHFDVTATSAANINVAYFTGVASALNTNNATTVTPTLVPGLTYYFQLTALDASGNESGCSASPGEVSKLITYRSDIDGSTSGSSFHRVDLGDYAHLSQHFLSSDLIADINKDGIVNLGDYVILSQEFLQQF